MGQISEPGHVVLGKQAHQFGHVLRIARGQIAQQTVDRRAVATGQLFEAAQIDVTDADIAGLVFSR
ncbi:hypothetical protein D3C78_1684820 [compost metagenome]